MCIRIKQIPKFQNKALLNIDTSELHELHCKSWSCPECAPKKAKRLYISMLNFFSQFKGVPLWTFTASPSIYTPIEHAKLLQIAFHNFLKECRRNKLISPDKQKFKYVRLLELHKSGYVHYHLLSTHFVNFEILSELWRNALLTAGYVPSLPKFSNVNTKWIPNAKQAAKYVVKYVIKAVADFPAFISRWSKSNNTAVSTKYITKDNFMIVDLNSRNPLLKLYLYSYSEKAQKQLEFLLFEQKNE